MPGGSSSGALCEAKVCHLDLCICKDTSRPFKRVLRPELVKAVKDYWALLDALFTPTDHFVLSVPNLRSYAKALMQR